MSNLYEQERWLGQAPEISAAQITREVAADVVIVGAGLAGVAAARAAVEAGATVVLLEKCARPQARSGDFAAMDSALSARWGRQNVDKTEIVNELMRDMAYKASQNILKRWAEEAGAALDWYLEAMPDIPVLQTTFEPKPQGPICIQPRRYPAPPGFDNAQERFKCYETTISFEPTHIPLFLANLRLAEQSGRLQTFCAAPVQKLLREAEGRVTGAVAKTKDGYLRAAARRAVVLATGDYMSNEAMLRRFLPGYADTPQLWTSYDEDRAPSNMGDGHRMGMWIGAKLQDAPHAPCAHHMGSVFGASGFLLLDSRGRRFVNEDAPGQQIGSQIENLPDKTAWQFVDGNWAQEIPRGYPSHGCVCYAVDDERIASGEICKGLTTNDNLVTPNMIEAALKKKQLFRADTLEELVALTGLPPAAALREIGRYNELCALRRDLDFGKRAARLFPVAQPPFYAARFTPATMIVALGGLQSDEEARCYDTAGQPIPGLYVAGNVQGNRIAVDYPLTVPGLSHSLALTFGRIAGRNAALGL